MLSDVDDQFNAELEHTYKKHNDPRVRGRGRGLRCRQRRRRDRRHHQLHQHLQPVGAGRRRAGRPQGARQGLDQQALGQDQPRARAARWSPIISKASGLERGPRTRSASTSSAMAAPPASAIRARSPEPISKAINENDLVAVSVLSRQPQFRRPRVARLPRQLSRLAAAGRRLRAEGHGPLRPRRTSRSAPAAMASPCSSRTSGRSNDEIRALIDAHVHSDMFRKRYADVYHGDERWRAIAVTRRRHLQLAAAIDLHPEPALLHRHDDDAGAAGATSTALGRWRCSAIRSPPTTSRRPARSSRTARPAAICSRTAGQPRPSSTATARGAAITK